jgi:hypothetical protein
MTADQSPVIVGAARRNQITREIFGVLVIALAAVLVGVSLGSRGGNLATLILCVLTGIFVLVPIVYIRAQPVAQRNVLLALFCLAFGARYVIPPIILYVPEQAPVDAPAMVYSQLRPWDVASGQLVILIALVAFLLGHLVPLLRVLGPGFPRPRLDWSPLATFNAGILLIIIGWPVSMAAILGLVPAALGSGVVSTVGSSLAFGHVLLALAYLRHRSKIALIVLCATIPITSFVGFLSGSKTSTVLVPAFIALTYVFERRRVPLGFVVVGLLALAVMYPASEFLRIYMLGSDFQFTPDVLMNPGSSASEVSTFIQSRDLGNYLSDGFSAVGQRLDSTGVVSVIVRDTPRLSPYQGGATLVLFFVSFIPRVLWPAKPDISIGQFITDVYGSGADIASSTAPSQIGDYYLNFGYYGVIIGMLVLGIAMRFAGDLLLGRKATATGILLATAIAYCIVIGFEMNVAMAQARIFFYVVPIIGLHLMVTRVVTSRSLRSTDAGTTV